MEALELTAAAAGLGQTQREAAAAAEEIDAGEMSGHGHPCLRAPVPPPRPAPPASPSDPCARTMLIKHARWWPACQMTSDLRLGSARPSDAYNVFGAFVFCAFCFLLFTFLAYA
jgi:hypothetical protein